MRTRVKICGITRPEDAGLAVELGAALLGFNFYPPSPRYIAPARARQIIAQIPPFVIAVGVLADEANAEHAAEVAREAGVAAIQLHSPRFGSTGRLADTYPVIRAVAVKDGFRAEDLCGLQASAFLLDAFDPLLHGGTGKTVNWSLAREAKKHGLIFLAGGLVVENVGEAIRQVRPFAVDVASGVESAPGKKDARKLREFFAAVDEANRQV